MAKDKEAPKGDRANELVRTLDFGVSGQVLQEFYTVATRKGGTPLTPDEAFAWIERLIRLPCIAIDAALVLRAIWISERHKIDYWDGAILAAAEALGADTLYTEDLNHGQMYGTVRAVNPFVQESPRDEKAFVACDLHGGAGLWSGVGAVAIRFE